MIERSHLKNVIFIQTILSFVLLRRVLKVSSSDIFSDSHNPDMVIFSFFRYTFSNDKKERLV